MERRAQRRPQRYIGDRELENQRHGERTAETHVYDPNLPRAGFPTLKSGEVRTPPPKPFDLKEFMGSDFEEQQDITPETRGRAAEELYKRHLQAVRKEHTSVHGWVKCGLIQPNGKAEIRQSPKLHIHKIDWAHLSDATQLVIYRAVSAVTPTTETAFAMLQLDKGDQDAFRYLYSFEQKLQETIDKAKARQVVARRGKSWVQSAAGTNGMSTQSGNFVRRRCVYTSEEAYNEKLAELNNTRAKIVRDRKTGFRIREAEVVEQIATLEDSRPDSWSDDDEEEDVSEASLPIERSEKSQEEEVFDADAIFQETIDRFGWPTEFFLDSRQVREGIRWLHYNCGWWRDGMERQVGIALATLENVQFTWDKCKSAPMDSPKDEIELSNDAEIVADGKDDLSTVLFGIQDLEILPMESRRPDLPVPSRGGPQSAQVSTNTASSSGSSIAHFLTRHISVGGNSFSSLSRVSNPEKPATTGAEKSTFDSILVEKPQPSRPSAPSKPFPSHGSQKTFHHGTLSTNSLHRNPFQRRPTPTNTPSMLASFPNVNVPFSRNQNNFISTGMSVDNSYGGEDDGEWYDKEEDDYDDDDDEFTGMGKPSRRPLRTRTTSLDATMSDGQDYYQPSDDTGHERTRKLAELEEEDRRRPPQQRKGHVSMPKVNVADIETLPSRTVGASNTKFFPTKNNLVIDLTISPKNQIGHATPPQTQGNRRLVSLSISPEKLRDVEQKWNASAAQDTLANVKSSQSVVASQATPSRVHPRRSQPAASEKNKLTLNRSLNHHNKQQKAVAGRVGSTSNNPVRVDTTMLGRNLPGSTIKNENGGVGEVNAARDGDGDTQMNAMTDADTKYQASHRAEHGSRGTMTDATGESLANRGNRSQDPISAAIAQSFQTHDSNMAANNTGNVPRPAVNSGGLHDYHTLLWPSDVELPPPPQPKIPAVGFFYFSKVHTRHLVSLAIYLQVTATFTARPGNTRNIAIPYQDRKAAELLPGHHVDFPDRAETKIAFSIPGGLRNMPGAVRGRYFQGPHGSLRWSPGTPLQYPPVVLAQANAFLPKVHLLFEKLLQPNLPKPEWYEPFKAEFLLQLLNTYNGHVVPGFILTAPDPEMFQHKLYKLAALLHLFCMSQKTQRLENHSQLAAVANHLDKTQASLPQDERAQELDLNAELHSRNLQQRRGHFNQLFLGDLADKIPTALAHRSQPGGYALIADGAPVCSRQSLLLPPAQYAPWNPAAMPQPAPPRSVTTGMPHPPTLPAPLTAPYAGPMSGPQQAVMPENSINPPQVSQNATGNVINDMQRMSMGRSNQNSHNSGTENPPPPKPKVQFHTHRMPVIGSTDTASLRNAAPSTTNTFVSAVSPLGVAVPGFCDRPTPPQYHREKVDFSGVVNRGLPLFTTAMLRIAGLPMPEPKSGLPAQQIAISAPAASYFNLAPPQNSSKRDTSVTNHSQTSNPTPSMNIVEHAPSVEDGMTRDHFNKEPVDSDTLFSTDTPSKQIIAEHKKAIQDQEIAQSLVHPAPPIFDQVLRRRDAQDASHSPTTSVCATPKSRHQPKSSPDNGDLKHPANSPLKGQQPKKQKQSEFNMIMRSQELAGNMGTANTPEMNVGASSSLLRAPDAEPNTVSMPLSKKRVSKAMAPSKSGATSPGSDTEMGNTSMTDDAIPDGHFIVGTKVFNADSYNKMRRKPQGTPIPERFLSQSTGMASANFEPNTVLGDVAPATSPTEQLTQKPKIRSRKGRPQVQLASTSKSTPQVVLPSMLAPPAFAVDTANQPKPKMQATSNSKATPSSKEAATHGSDATIKASSNKSAPTKGKTTTPNTMRPSNSGISTLEPGTGTGHQGADNPSAARGRKK